MSEDQEQGGPPRVVDKRGQKKDEPQPETVEKVIIPDEEDPAPTSEELEAGLERIQELRRKFSEDGTLSDEDAQELLDLQARMQPTQDQQVTRCVTAFVVVLNHDGSVYATSDLNAPFMLDREANLHDMTAGSAIVMRDIQTSVTLQAMEVVGQHRMAKLQEQQMAQKVREAIARPGGLPPRIPR